MVIKYQNESTFTFLILSEMTEAIYKKTNRHNVLTDSFHSAVLEGYIEQQQSDQTFFYTRW